MSEDEVVPRRMFSEAVEKWKAMRRERDYYRSLCDTGILGRERVRAETLAPILALCDEAMSDRMNDPAHGLVRVVDIRSVAFSAPTEEA